MAIHVLDVGQCGVDGPRMEKLWRERLSATVTRADTADDAMAALEEEDFDLILVNRVLAADDSPGLEVIDRLVADGIQTPIMLVSDREDAQEEAVKHGAIHGFGKSQLSDPATLELIRKAAGGK